MKVLAIANGAGSAGKSATATSLAALEAAAGRRVLLIDADRQATGTGWVGADPSLRTVAGVFRGEPLADLVVGTAVDGLEIVPSSDQLEADMATLRGVGLEMRLRQALQKAVNRWDCVIIDCPGSLALITVAAVVASTHVVSVTRPTLKEIQGIGSLAQIIDDVQAIGLNPAAHLAAVVPCEVPTNAGALYDEGMQLLGEAYPELVTSRIRRSVKVPESYQVGLPVTVYVADHPVAQDYRDVHSELVRRDVL